MELIDYYRKIQHKACMEIIKCTCQFMILVKDDKPKAHSSCVLIEIQDHHFLLTAAHVSDDDMSYLYVGIDKNTYHSIGGTLFSNDPQGIRKKDKVDISIVKLDNDSVEKLKKTYEFLDYSEIGINHQFNHSSQYVSAGFPCSKSKYNRYYDEFKSKPFYYATMPANDNLYVKLDYEPFVNVIVHYDQKNVLKTRTQKVACGPDPIGISGSGLWHIPPQIYNKDRKIEKKLVGILTERRKGKYWIGTRIDIISEVIRQKFCPNIEMSHIVKVNLKE